MYAIIETGGKQYKVKQGDVVYIEKLDLNANDSYEFENVLAVYGEDSSVKFGNPFVQGAKVKATVVAQVKGRKIVVFKYKPKKDYRRKNGHRQPYTKVKIESIEV